MQVNMQEVEKAMIVILLTIAIASSYIFYSSSTVSLIHDYDVSSLDYIVTSQRSLKGHGGVYSNLRISEVLTRKTMLVITKQNIVDSEVKPTTNVHVIDSVKPAPKLSSTSEGYILPYSIFEEQTSGAKNLWQLQIFAKQVGMQVVEPFAKDSLFTMSGIAPNFGQALRFGDYFDKDRWNEMVVKDGGHPLVKWDEFIKKAPRKVIILHTLKNKDIQKPLTIAYDDNTTACGTGRQIAPSDMLWIKENFDVIKTMCYLCATNLRHPLSISNFTSILLSNHNIKPNQVTLITVGWLGIRTSRVHLSPITIFAKVLNQKLPFPPSKRVMTAYKVYAQQYIGDHKYVGIIFRTHHVLYFSPLTGSFANQSKYLLECSQNLNNVLNKVRTKWKIFLAYDMGMFGSKNYIRNKQLAPLQEQIFLDVFNGSLQVNEREENLINAANGITDTGVIAQLEKVIATNADCIVLLGPHSTFVRSSSSLYISQHHTKRCIVSICAEKVYDDNHKLISSNIIPSNLVDHH